MKAQIKIVITMVAILLSAQLHAQKLTGGITAGVTTVSVQISNIHSQFASTIKGDIIYGFEGGLFAKLTYESFYIKAKPVLNCKTAFRG